MPTQPKSSWSDQKHLFRGLKNELQRQLVVAESGSLTRGNDPLITLKHMGPEYCYQLRAMADHVENLESHQNCDENTGASRRSRTSPLPNVELFWQIPAFCEPSSQYIDVKLCRSMSADLNDPIAHNGEFWGSDKLHEWASVEESSILLVQGDHQCSDEIVEIVTDLIQYLEENDQLAVWIPYDWAISTNFQHADDVLKQLAVQTLQEKIYLHFDINLAQVVKLFQLNSESQTRTNWFDVLQFLLRGMTNLYMVIDLGVLEARCETASSWINQFSRLFERLRLEDSAVLKVVLLNTWPLPTSSPKPPTIDIHSRSGPVHLERIRRAARSEGTRYLPFPTYKSKIRASQSTHLDETSSSDTDRLIGEVAAAKGAAKGPASWFTQMKSFERLIDASRKEPDAAHPRVKIAILDTGLDLTHPDIVQAQKNGRLQYWDFVDKTEDIKDDDGHGTHCTSIALKYAPNAEIFVGRVFRKSEADTDSCGILTTAIRHAAEKWKVDIISLSLGFTEDDDDLREVIRAASTRILIFASAANNTINEVKPIRFPASMTEVICIFSSNSFSRPSDFNPDPRFDRPNLTFPGEKVRGAWPSTLTDAETIERKGATYKDQSGTSCSASLAAAVAAGVLEFAWQERTPPVRRVNQLKHYTGMTQLFITRMVDDYKVGDNSYNYVKPWKLISTSCRKDEINVLISDVLENMKK